MPDILLPGDVVIQTAGQPWVFAAWLFTGHGVPHAAMVDHVDVDGTILVVEDTYNGVQLNPWTKPGWKARRPLCDEATRLGALADYKARVGQEGYGYDRLGEIMALARMGWLAKLPEDPDEAREWKDCSESITFHQRVAGSKLGNGFDPMPGMAARAVLPYDLLKTPMYADLDL